MSSLVVVCALLLANNSPVCTHPVDRAQAQVAVDKMNRDPQFAATHHTSPLTIFPEANKPGGAGPLRVPSLD